MTITKEDLINAVANRADLSQTHSRKVVESFLEIMKSTLERGENILVTGFGKFEVRNKRARIGRNPKNGVPATIRARRVVVFKTSAVFRERLNGGKFSVAVAVNPERGRCSHT
ncbi:MAG: integration host factor subunit alpha [Proteobacteria bacterium]|nr:integration host factor subunit alpha [Pseudomonadota bacterium]